MRSRSDILGQRTRRNRRASSVPSGAIASGGMEGVEVNIYDMNCDPHPIRCTSKTSCKYIVLALKKKLGLANDAYFSLYDVITDDPWWDQTNRTRLESTDLIQDITAKWPTSENHVLVFRRRIYVPESPLEAEVKSAKSASGAHLLAYWEASFHARTMMYRYISMEQVYMLAAMQLQARYGDAAEKVFLGDVPKLLRNSKAQSHVKAALPLYIHPDIVRRCGVPHIVDGVLSKWATFAGLDTFHSQTVFLGYVHQSPLYGSEMMEVGVRQKTDGTDEPRRPFREDMSGPVNFAISHYGLRLFPVEEDFVVGDIVEVTNNGMSFEAKVLSVDHMSVLYDLETQDGRKLENIPGQAMTLTKHSPSNLTIWEHSFENISQWVTSESGDFFAYVVENIRVYVKSPHSHRIQSLLEEYLAIKEAKHTESNLSVLRRSSSMRDENVSAPQVRRSSVIRLREVTKERNDLANIISSEEKTSNQKEEALVLQDGWEEFWSDEHERFYYYNASTEATTWDRKKAYKAASIQSPQKNSSMLLDAAMAAASHADMKDLDKELKANWCSAFLSVEITQVNAQRYASIFLNAGMDFSALLTLTESQLARLGINSTEEVLKILKLREIAAGLPETTPTSELAESLSSPPTLRTRSESKDEVEASNVWAQLVENGTGRHYYYNKSTGETRWELPDGASLHSDGAGKEAKTSKLTGRQRRAIITGESLGNETFVKVVHPKSPSESALIKSALRKNFVFEALSEEDLKDVIDSMSRRSVPPGMELIKQGDNGDYFYVIQNGDFDIFVNDQKVVSFTQGDSFGELALLYNCPRAATCKSRSTSEVWALDRLTFRHLLRNAGKQAVDAAKEALQKVELLKDLTESQLESIATAVKQTTFKKGDVIVNYGDVGELFYMIKEGEVVCVVPSSDGVPSRRASIPLTLGAGQYFGERALLNDVTRGADVIAQSDRTVCLTLDRENFDTLLGPMKDIIKSNLAYQCLQSISFISSALTKDQLKKVAAVAEEEYFEENEYIMSIHSGIDYDFYIIKDGEIGVVDTSHSVVELLTVGQHFGQQALMSHSPPEPKQSYYVSSESGANVFRIKRKKLEHAIGISLKDGLAAAGASLATIKAVERQDAKDEVKNKGRVLNPDNLTLDELERKKILGEGTFGRVYLVRAARSKYAEHYALKIQQKHQIDELKQKRNIMNEKRIMEELDHPFTLRLEATFQDPDCLYMLLEIVTGGELFDLLADRAPDGVLPSGEAAFYTACVVSAFNHFWEKDIIYRDLKPENLMLDRFGYIKVVDYGFAKVLNGKLTHTCCGTLEYFAPELVRGKGYGKPIDIWGVGILLFEMLVGYTPFNVGSNGEICKAIVGKKLEMPREITDPGARSLINKLLDKNPLRRIGCGASGPTEIMSHPWFSNFNWDNLKRRKIRAPEIGIPKLAAGKVTVDPACDFEDAPVVPYTKSSDWCNDF